LLKIETTSAYVSASANPGMLIVLAD